MPVPGQTLVNPLDGNVYEFLETAQSTNGERVKIRMTLKSKGALVPNHIHVIQDELYEVESGKFTMFMKGRRQVLSAGEQILTPCNTPHNHYNEFEEPAVVIQTVSPALDFDLFMENLIGLASDGKMKNGKPGLIQELVGLKYIDSKAYLADMPVFLQKLLMNLMGPIGRLLGYRAIYAKYTGVEK